MKTNVALLLLSFFLSASVNSIYGQNNIDSRTDERCEMMSIIYRLAGAREYAASEQANGFIKQYDDDIKSYFAGYTNHKAVKLARELRNNGVGYDAAMTLAIHLDIKDSQIQLNNKIYNYLATTNDKRWNKKRLDIFVAELNNFYRDTKFHDFYSSHENVYYKAQASMDKILRNNMNFAWFGEFYGVSKSMDHFNVIVSLVNNQHNYGPKIVSDDQTESVYAVIGCGSKANEAGEIEFSVHEAVRLLVHEFSHSFCNHLIDINYDKLEKQGEIIFQPIEEKMKKQAYGKWKTVLYEALVRAATINYVYHNTSAEAATELIRYEKGRGFFWIEKLTNKLNLYDENRSEYPTLESFMPEIIATYDEIANDIKNGNYPRVISSSLKQNSIIDPSDNEIIIKFNKDMSTDRYGFTYGKGEKEHFPKFDKIEWLDARTLKLVLNLEKGKEYSFKTFDASLCDTDGYPVIQEFELDFITK